MPALSLSCSSADPALTENSWEFKVQVVFLGSGGWRRELMSGNVTLTSKARHTPLTFILHCIRMIPYSNTGHYTWT